MTTSSDNNYQMLHKNACGFNRLVTDDYFCCCFGFQLDTLDWKGFIYLHLWFDKRRKKNYYLIVVFNILIKLIDLTNGNKKTTTIEWSSAFEIGFFFTPYFIYSHLIFCCHYSTHRFPFQSKSGTQWFRFYVKSSACYATDQSFYDLIIHNWDVVTVYSTFYLMAEESVCL